MEPRPTDPTNSVDAHLTAELEDYDLLKVTFDVQGHRKAAAAAKIRRSVNERFRRSSPGVWSPEASSSISWATRTSGARSS